MNKLTTMMFALLAMIVAAAEALAALPRPILRVIGAQQYWDGNQAWIRYELSIDNADQFQQKLFNQPAGDCTAHDRGTAWIGVYDIVNPSQVVFSFCPRSRRELTSIRYSLKKTSALSGIVLVKFVDLRSNEQAWSNVVNTVRATPPVSSVRPRPVSPY